MNTFERPKTILAQPRQSDKALERLPESAGRQVPSPDRRLNRSSPVALRFTCVPENSDATWLENARC
jgi:hypothetical protein